MSARTVNLNNGTTIPIIGLGTWKSKPGEVEQAVKHAVAVGYRHIDCARVYENENEVGAALKDIFLNQGIKREDLYIVSKLWNSYHSPNLVEVGLKESLQLLGLEYLDLYLMHSPMGFKENAGLNPVDENGKLIYSDVDYIDTWRAMEECVQKGMVKSIGVSNFNSHQLQRILDSCRIKPVTNQVECHPYLNQEKLIEFCHAKGIVITAYSPLGSPDRPFAKANDPCLIADPKVKEIAGRYGKSPAQILIRYQVLSIQTLVLIGFLILDVFMRQIQRGLLVIPKSITKTRIEENFNVFDFELTADDIMCLNLMNCNERYLHHHWVLDHPYFPFNAEF